MIDPPAFYDDLDATEREAWGLLVRGAADRKSPFHTMSVASISLNGDPRVRKVVLRDVDAGQRRLRFYTDIRSAKVAEFEANPKVALLFYGASEKVQIRVEGTARVHRSDALADEAWATTRPESRACYRILPGPGEGLGEPGDVSWQDAGPEEEGGRDAFCAIVIEALSLEWLYLHHAGHRRACFTYGATAEARWLVP